jgi:hypothetical protein
MLVDSRLRRAVRYGVLLLAAVASIATSEQHAQLWTREAKASGTFVLTPASPTATARLHLRASQNGHLAFRPMLPAPVPALQSSGGDDIEEYVRLIVTIDTATHYVWLLRNGTATQQLAVDVGGDSIVTAAFTLAPLAAKREDGGSVDLAVSWEAIAMISGESAEEGGPAGAAVALEEIP